MWPVSFTKSGLKRLRCSVRVLGAVWMCSDLSALCFLQLYSRIWHATHILKLILELHISCQF